MKTLLIKRVTGENTLWLLSQVIDSFSSDRGKGKGIPLGNLTSQVFANIYLNELDQFVKNTLKVTYYLRYADDFLFLSTQRESLLKYLNPITKFLVEHLQLKLHPRKIIIRKLDWGIDFLGYIVLPHYCLSRTKTKRRMFKKLRSKIGSPNLNQSFASYLGYLKNADSYQLTQKLKNDVWFWSRNNYIS